MASRSESKSKSGSGNERQVKVQKRRSESSNRFSRSRSKERSITKSEHEKRENNNPRYANSGKSKSVIKSGKSRSGSRSGSAGSECREGVEKHRKGSYQRDRYRGRRYSSSDSADNRKEDTTIYVNNLHHRMKEKHLKEPFEKAGEIEKVEIVRDPFSGESRGFGFVTYMKPEDAITATEQMNKTELHGRTIACEIAKRKRARGPTPGRYLGKFKSRARRDGRSRSRSDSYRRSSRHRHRDYDRRSYDRRDNYRRSSRDYRHYEKRERYPARERHREDMRRRRSRSMS